MNVVKALLEMSKKSLVLSNRGIYGRRRKIKNEQVL